VARLSSLFALVAGVLVLCGSAAPAAQAVPLFDVGASSVDTLPMTRLPAWVQVAPATARLYSDDTSEALIGPRLTRYTFLRVLGGGSDRLQVQVYDESGDPGRRGWVDPNDVLPSAPGADWLVAAVPTTLWRSTDPGADAVRSIDRFTPMQQVDGPVQHRIEVQIDAADFSGALDLAWIDTSDTGAALPPRTAVPPPASAPAPISRGLSNAALQRAFLDATARAARAGAARTGVPASVTVAQAILESDWGRSSLAVDANNYFGIKAIGSLGSDGVVWLPTGEVDADGQAYQTISAFRAYKSLTDSVVDHDRLLGTTSRYAAAMRSSNDPKEFAQQLSEAGYSTDPAYADKLVALMDGYALYRLD
jgi:hypothetical protein